MSTSWREIVLTLADPNSELIVGVAPELDGGSFAQIELPGAHFRIVRDSPDEAMRALAYDLADLRLAQSLEAAGWTDIDDVIDQSTYVVARDLEGTVWAIGAASRDDDRRAYIEPDMRRDRLAERIAFVEPLDTATAQGLTATLLRYRMDPE